MTGLSIDADIDELEDLFGKTVDDLQSDIEIGDTGITGTVKYIADYSSAGYTGDEESGNFLVLHADVPDFEGATIVAELVNGVHGPVTLQEDGIVIFRIADKSSQKVKFVASKTGYPSVTKVFDLSGLTLNNA